MLTTFQKTNQAVDNEKTFSQFQSAIVTKEFVCAICYGELAEYHILNCARVVVACPLHGNVCDTGRVTRATASIALENSFKNYYRAVSAFPDLWGGLWKQGVNRDHAQKICSDSVCTLCGRDLSTQLIFDPQNGKLSGELATIICPTHGDVGKNRWGFVKAKDYNFIPPFEIRKIEKASKLKIALPETQVVTAKVEPFFSKLGSVGIGDRSGDSVLNHFTVIFSGKSRALELKFQKAYKNTNKLNIRLPGRNIRDFFYSSYQCYRQGGLVASAELSRSGHFVWKYYRDPETLEIEISGGIARTRYGVRLLDEGVLSDKPVYTDSHGKEHYLRQSAKMQVCISELTSLDGVPNVGFFDLNLNSKEDIDGLYSELTNLEKMAFSEGTTLAGMKFSLSRPKYERNYSVSLAGLVSR